jgi:hypothetical protein
VALAYVAAIETYVDALHVLIAGDKEASRRSRIWSPGPSDAEATFVGE